jgi:2-polyprenyl-3-methyl-5-hydroxy-6-metoxy-1,4-benzoquinol methylase
LCLWIDVQSSFHDEYFQIEDVHWWFRGRRQILRTLLRPYLPRPVRILDIGSGGGAVAQALVEFGLVTACDVEVRCATEVSRRPGMTFAHGRAEALPFADGSFDLVTALDVLEHVEDDARVLSEMGRVAGPHGAVAVTVPAYEWMWGRQDDISGHRRRYRQQLLRQRLEGAGFRIERLTGFNTILFPAVAAVRLLRRAESNRHTPQAEALKSDFSMTRPGRLNDALAAIFSAERVPLRFINLPFGVSLFAFARRGA